jgi:hypothetical protein
MILHHNVYEPCHQTLLLKTLRQSNKPLEWTCRHQLSPQVLGTLPATQGQRYVDS